MSGNARRLYRLLIALWVPAICGHSLAQGLPNRLCTRGLDVASRPTITVTGELTRKGSDSDSWWALRLESGDLYRLELASNTLESAMRSLQNSEVTVSGAVSGKFLSINVICVTSVSQDKSR